jgi:N6-adenosine-specific RNA methylase IME4
MQKFKVIVADPPWSFKDTLKMSDVKRSAEANYQIMSLHNIKTLPIHELIDSEGAILALWVPSSLLKEGLETMEAWGFQQKQTYIWVKTKKHPFKDFLKSKDKLTDLMKVPLSIINGLLAFGMGRLFRQTHEICLVGTSNNKIYQQLQNKSQRSVSLAPNLKHSAKPEALQDSLEMMFPNANKLELFARRQRPNWTCLGNEVCQGEDIRDSLIKLK